MDVYIRLNKTVDPDGKKEESKKAVWEKAEEVSVLSVQEQMEEFMFLGLRKTDGVSEKSFFETFGVQIDTVYGETMSSIWISYYPKEAESQHPLFQNKNSLIT